MTDERVSLLGTLIHPRLDIYQLIHETNPFFNSKTGPRVFLETNISIPM